MRNKLNLLTLVCMMTASVVAQEGIDSVEDIMNELMNYEEVPNPEADYVPPFAVDKKTADPAKPEDAPIAAEENVVGVDYEDLSEQETAEPKKEEAGPLSGSDDPVTVDTKPPFEDTVILAGADADTPPMEMDELMRLMDQVDQRDREAVQAMQELADLIRNEPADSARSEYMRKLLEEMLRDDPPKRAFEIDRIKAVAAAWSTELVLRSYALVPGAAERLKLGNATHAVAVERFLSLVDFPKGASAIYQPETETIFVNNTRENLAVLQTMLETMGVLKGYGNTLQVEIEAKFVEVSEGTLEALGFQWNFEDPTRVSIGGTDMDVTDGPDGLFSDSLRGSANNANGALPFDRKVGLGDGTVDPSGYWSTFRFVDNFGTESPSLSVENRAGTSFEMLINALDQNSGADVLSAPRILTRNGEEATIQVGEIHYFPEVYEGDAAQATIVNVSYEDFEEKLLGVELTVTPKVSNDGNIMLELNPSISELAGWQSYQLVPGSVDENPNPVFTTFRGSHYNHRQLETSRPYIDHEAIVASLPIYKVRKIETQVTIADGSTIGMGGLISENIERYEDRVPVLGSIPLVGRLFRSEGERAVKRNLLIFVTARIIDADGRINPTRSFE